MCTVCEDHESGKGQKGKGKEKKVLGERKRYHRSVRESKQTAMPGPTPSTSFATSSGHFKRESKRLKQRQAELNVAGNALRVNIGLHWFCVHIMQLSLIYVVIAGHEVIEEEGVPAEDALCASSVDAITGTNVSCGDAFNGVCSPIEDVENIKRTKRSQQKKFEPY